MEKILSYLLSGSAFLTVFLMVLKLTGSITWDWLWVFAPILIVIAIIVLLTLFLAFVKRS